MDDVRMDTYRAWTDTPSPWTRWSKPVIFTSLKPEHYSANIEAELPDVSWAPRTAGDAAIVLDLPARLSVRTAVALAQRGYQPVPLYNSCAGPGMLVDIAPLLEEIAGLAGTLRKLSLPGDSPPCFMLDARRMEGSTLTDVSRFDNRWVVLPQDMPSAQMLKQQGISRIILVSDRVIRQDLAHILRRYQEAGLAIIQGDDTGRMVPVNVPTPSRFRGLFYRISVLSGLKRNSAGGFGSMVPPTHTGSGSGPAFYGGRMG